MPVVFVVASDWALRTAVRAELRESAINALGMETPDEVGRALAAGERPAAIVLEATSPLTLDTAVQELVNRVPTVLIASRTEIAQLPRAAAVLFRPVLIATIVARLRQLLEQTHSA